MEVIENVGNQKDRNARLPRCVIIPLADHKFFIRIESTIIFDFESKANQILNSKSKTS